MSKQISQIILSFLFSIILFAFPNSVFASGEPVGKDIPDTPQLALFQEEEIVIPEKVKKSDYPAEKKVVWDEELSVSDLRGDMVYAEDQEFFVVEGKPAHVVHLEPGVNVVYFISILEKKKKLYKKIVLLRASYEDVSENYKMRNAIEYLCMLRIMGPYTDEGGVFLPDNMVPKKEFSIILQQASQDHPAPVKFSRLGEKSYIEMQAALDALERNFGKPLKPWGELFGLEAEALKKPISRVQLVQALLNMKHVKKKVDELVEDFGLERLQ